MGVKCPAYIWDLAPDLGLDFKQLAQIVKNLVIYGGVVLVLTFFEY